MKIVALLESMWGWGGYNDPGQEAPRFFRINPDNFSGRRLYQLCGDANLIVTNSCRVVQASANHHGTPDPGYVRENLERAHADGCDLFLICGRVARETYQKTGLDLNSVLFMDHPAARRWTTASLNEVKQKIAAHAVKGEIA
jgi:hypothetical protein